MARKIELAPTDQGFAWPQCSVCAAPMEFHVFDEDPVWCCCECGTLD